MYLPSKAVAFFFRSFSVLFWFFFVLFKEPSLNVACLELTGNKNDSAWDERRFRCTYSFDYLRKDTKIK